MTVTEKQLKELDQWLGVVVIGLVVAYLFMPNPLIGVSASLLFLYWLGVDIYVAYRTKSIAELALDGLIIALIAYSIYNPQFMSGAVALSPIYVAYKLLTLI